jgi:hypothetical protein
MFWTHHVIAPWQTDAWLTEMRRSLRPAQYARMIENQFTTTESTFIDMSWWDACVDKNLGHMVAQSNLPILHRLRRQREARLDGFGCRLLGRRQPEDTAGHASHFSAERR